jgi:hypothetical protein
MDPTYSFLLVAVVAVTTIYYVCVRKMNPATKQPQAGAELSSNRQ